MSRNNEGEYAMTCLLQFALLFLKQEAATDAS